MALDDDEKRRIARVIWTYSGKKQPDFEADLGFKKDRLRSMLARGAHSPPTLDEMIAMAKAAGVPRAVALDGWAAADPMAQIEKRLSQLQAELDEQRRIATEQGVLLSELQVQVAAASSSGARAPGRKPAVAPIEPGPLVPGSATCIRPKGVQTLRFSAKKYPNIRRHYLSATAKGWPRIMVLNRTGAAERRARLLRDSMPRPGFDRDEYPAAIGRGRANGASRSLLRGTNPIGWMADVRYVPTSENRSHGASLGGKLRRFCNGTRFRYAFS